MNSSTFDPTSQSESYLSPSPASTLPTNEPWSQTSEQEREETKTFLQDFFLRSTDPLEPNYCWLETTGRPPVRKRVKSMADQKIATQIICQDAEDETPFVKLVISHIHLNFHVFDNPTL